MLCIVIHVSHQLIGFIGLLYLITGMVGWLYLPLSTQLKGVGAILHAMHGYVTWYYTLSLTSCDAIIYLEYTKERQWLVANNDGALYLANLQPGSVCTNKIIALHLKLIANNEHRYIWLFSDSISSEAARKLRQILWWDVQ